MAQHAGRHPGLHRRKAAIGWPPPASGTPGFACSRRCPSKVAGRATLRGGSSVGAGRALQLHGDPSEPQDRPEAVRAGLRRLSGGCARIRSAAIAGRRSDQSSARDWQWSSRRPRTARPATSSFRHRRSSNEPRSLYRRGGDDAVRPSRRAVDAGSGAGGRARRAGGCGCRPGAHPGALQRQRLWRHGPGPGADARSRHHRTGALQCRERLRQRRHRGAFGLPGAAPRHVRHGAGVGRRAADPARRRHDPAAAQRLQDRALRLAGDDAAHRLCHARHALSARAQARARRSSPASRSRTVPMACATRSPSSARK